MFYRPFLLLLLLLQLVLNDGHERQSRAGASFNIASSSVDSDDRCELLVANAIHVIIAPCGDLVDGAGGGRAAASITSSSSTSTIRNIHDVNQALIDNRCFSKNAMPLLQSDNALPYSITLVSYSTDNIANYAVYAYAINSLYAAANSYYFKVSSGDHFVDYEPIDRRWNRVKLLYEILTDDEYCKSISPLNNSECYLVWVDSDLVFLQPTYSLVSIINEHKYADIIISAEYHAETGVANTGCFIIKKSEWSVQFLRDWWDNYDHSLAHDQIFFDRLYKARLPESSDRIAVLPITTLNSIPPVELTLEEEDNVLHLMGVDDKLRETVLRSGFMNVCSHLSEKAFPVQSPSSDKLMTIGHSKNVLRRYMTGEGMVPQIGLTRLSLQRLFSDRYDNLLSESTSKIAQYLILSLNDSLPASAAMDANSQCQSVFNIDMKVFKGVLVSDKDEGNNDEDEDRKQRCICSERHCMDSVLESLSAVRETLIQSRTLFRTQQSSDASTELEFARNYYGDIEFLVKISAVFSGRLLHRLGAGGEGHVSAKYKEHKALKGLLLQVLHFSAVVCNDFLDSYYQFNSFYSEISFLNYSRFDAVAKFQRSAIKDMARSDMKDDNGDVSNAIFQADISGGITIARLHELIEVYLDILLQFVSLEQIHLVEEMVLSFHSQIGVFHANHNFDPVSSRLHFEKAHEVSLRLLTSGRGNLYQLLQPYLLWGRAMHGFGLHQESFDALLELFCIIDDNELVLLDKNQRQLSEEHAVLIELYFLNAQNIEMLHRDKKLDIVINPSVGELCAKSSHGGAKMAPPGMGSSSSESLSDAGVDADGSSLSSIDMSGFYVQGSFWKFKLQYLCGLAKSWTRSIGTLDEKYTSLCQQPSDNSTPGQKKIIRRRKKKAKKN